MKSTARIASLGAYLPSRVLTNADLEKMVDTTDDWIFTRTGMKERRIAGEDEPPSVMGAGAALSCLKKVGVEPSEVDLILACTLTPDHLAPSTAALIQARIGASQAAAFDLNAACSGFVYGLSMAKALVESGAHTRILVVATEKMSAFADYSDRSSCILWGDGAVAALVMSQGPGLLIRHTLLGANGNESELLKIPAGGSALPACQETIDKGLHYMFMAGREVFKHAVRYMEQVAHQCCQKANLTMDDIRWVVPHQANARIMEAVAKRLDIPEERVVNTVHKYGNTSASAVALALHDLMEEKGLEEGDKVLLVVFGAGFTWGGALLEQSGGKLDE